MPKHTYFLGVCFYFTLFCLLNAQQPHLLPRLNTIFTDRPIIGILAQPYYFGKNFIPKPDDDRSINFIPASYVQWIQSAGGRVVPIDYYYPDTDHLDMLLSKLNAILIFGEFSLEFYNTTVFNYYNSTISRILDYSVESLSKHQRDFPVFGVGDGLNLISCYFSRAGFGILSSSNNENHYENLVFENTQNSEIFQSFISQEKQALESKEAVFFNSKYGMTVTSFRDDKQLNNNFHFTSMSPDHNGVWHVTSLQGKDLKINGISFMPEKNQYEVTEGQNIQFSCVTLSQKVANFFVDQAKLNSNYMNSDQFESLCIYNKSKKYLRGSQWVEVYYF